MIGKIGIGKRFSGLCHYVLGEDKKAEVLASQGVRWWSADAMAADFEMQRASERPTLRQAVMQVALAWAPEEKAKLTNEVMVSAAMDYMRHLKIDPELTQWALVRHGDQAHPHAHLVINRVRNDGSAIDCGNTFANSAAACRSIEDEYGFIDAGEIGEARHRKLVGSRVLGEREEVKLLVKDAVAKCLPSSHSWEELEEALAAEGVTMKRIMVKGSPGVIFTHNAHSDLPVKGSEVAREYSIGNLRKTLESHRGWAEEMAAESSQASSSQQIELLRPVADEPVPPVEHRCQALFVLDNQDRRGAGRLERLATELDAQGVRVSEIAGDKQLVLEVSFLPDSPHIGRISNILDLAAASPGFELRESTGDRSTRRQAVAKPSLLWPLSSP